MERLVRLSIICLMVGAIWALAPKVPDDERATMTLSEEDRAAALNPHMYYTMFNESYRNCMTQMSVSDAWPEKLKCEYFAVCGPPAYPNGEALLDRYQCCSACKRRFYRCLCYGYSTYACLIQYSVRCLKKCDNKYACCKEPKFSLSFRPGP